MISESPRRDVTRDVERWSRNLQLEVDGATVYTSMARNESEETVAALYERLAAMESRHARIWGRKLRAAGAWRGHAASLLDGDAPDGRRLPLRAGHRRPLSRR